MYIRPSETIHQPHDKGPQGGPRNAAHTSHDDHYERIRQDREVGARSEGNIGAAHRAAEARYEPRQDKYQRENTIDIDTERGRHRTVAVGNRETDKKGHRAMGVGVQQATGDRTLEDHPRASRPDGPGGYRSGAGVLTSIPAGIVEKNQKPSLRAGKYLSIQFIFNKIERLPFGCQLNLQLYLLYIVGLAATYI